MIFDTEKAVRTAFDFIIDNKKDLSPFLKKLFKNVQAEKKPSSPDALGYTLFKGLYSYPEIYVSEKGILGSLTEAGATADAMREKMTIMRDANWQKAISSLDNMEKMYIGILSHEIAHLFADNALFPLVQMISSDVNNPVNKAMEKKLREAEKEGKKDAQFTPEEIEGLKKELTTFIDDMKGFKLTQRERQELDAYLSLAVSNVSFRQIRQLHNLHNIFIDVFIENALPNVIPASYDANNVMHNWRELARESLNYTRGIISPKNLLSILGDNKDIALGSEELENLKNNKSINSEHAGSGERVETALKAKEGKSLLNSSLLILQPYIDPRYDIGAFDIVDFLKGSALGEVLEKEVSGVELFHIQKEGTITGYDILNELREINKANYEISLKLSPKSAHLTEAEKEELGVSAAYFTKIFNVFIDQVRDAFMKTNEMVNEMKKLENQSLNKVKKLLEEAAAIEKDSKIKKALDDMAFSLPDSCNKPASQLGKELADLQDETKEQAVKDKIEEARKILKDLEYTLDYDNLADPDDPDAYQPNLPPDHTKGTPPPSKGQGNPQQNQQQNNQDQSQDKNQDQSQGQDGQDQNQQQNGQNSQGQQSQGQSGQGQDQNGQDQNQGGSPQQNQGGSGQQDVNVNSSEEVKDSGSQNGSNGQEQQEKEGQGQGEGQDKEAKQDSKGAGQDKEGKEKDQKGKGDEQGQSNDQKGGSSGATADQANGQNGKTLGERMKEAMEKANQLSDGNKDSLKDVCKDIKEHNTFNDEEVENKLKEQAQKNKEQVDKKLDEVNKEISDEIAQSGINVDASKIKDIENEIHLDKEKKEEMVKQYNDGKDYIGKPSFYKETETDKYLERIFKPQLEGMLDEIEKNMQPTKGKRAQFDQGTYKTVGDAALKTRLTGKIKTNAKLERQNFTTNINFVIDTSGSMTSRFRYINDKNQEITLSYIEFAKSVMRTTAKFLSVFGVGINIYTFDEHPAKKNFSTTFIQNPLDEPKKARIERESKLRELDAYIYAQNAWGGTYQTDATMASVMNTIDEFLKSDKNLKELPLERQMLIKMNGKKMPSTATIMITDDNVWDGTEKKSEILMNMLNTKNGPKNLFCIRMANDVSEIDGVRRGNDKEPNVSQVFKGFPVSDKWGENGVAICNTANFNTTKNLLIAASGICETIKSVVYHDLRLCGAEIQMEKIKKTMAIKGMAD